MTSKSRTRARANTKKFAPAYKKTKKCGKRRYRDSIAAKLALANVAKSDSPTRRVTEHGAYFCQNCKGWHLTSGPGMIRND